MAIVRTLRSRACAARDVAATGASPFADPSDSARGGATIDARQSPERNADGVSRG
jgi:hypothetical protein